MNLKSLLALAINPWVIIGSLALGFALGVMAPDVSRHLAVVGDVYVDLLKMIVLPFMISAIVFSLQRLLKDGGASRILGRVAVVFVVFALLTAVVGVFSLMLARPGADLSPAKLQSFGQIVGADTKKSDTAMSLKTVDAAPKPLVTFSEVVLSLIPANIFAALAGGETLKALVFALLFGFAVSQVPGRVSDALTNSLDTVYQSCQLLTRWLNYPLPLVLVCMSASQLAKTGLGSLEAMTAFVLTFALASLLVLVLAVLVIWKRSEASLGVTLHALRGPFALALATRSSATCMPMMIDMLADGLGFARAKVELLVPLTVSLLRLGPVLYYVCATLFIAQLYDRDLGLAEVSLVVVACILAGFASAGMTGLVIISLTGMACGYLGLPFEAAFMLFVAVDPICDMLRTLVLVVGNSAAVSLICSRPLKI